MVNTKQALESEFIDVPLVSNSMTKKLVIIKDGEYKTATYKKGTPEEETKRELRIPVMIDNVEKIWRINKQSTQNLTDAWGEETITWVGKVVALDVKSQGGMTFVVGKPFVDKTPREATFDSK